MTSGQTSTGIVPLLSDLEIEICAKDCGGWSTVITQKGITVAKEDTKTEPWVQTEIVKKLSKQVGNKTAYKSGAIQDAISQYFEEFKASDDGKALLSEPARKVIEETEAVIWETSDPPIIRIILKSGDEWIFKISELASPQPKNLNSKWLETYEGVLYATTKDFSRCIEFWLEIKQKIEVFEDIPEFENVLRDLRLEISQCTISDDRKKIQQEGWVRIGENIVVAPFKILEFLEKHGKGSNDRARFSKFMRKSGFMIKNTSPLRIDNEIIRAWFLNDKILLKNTSSMDSVEDISSVDGVV
ncbi:hypothetical protein [Methanoplanus endosymbiosus]|uniref:Uncharacterized protein n=1 Tax=Methanoplanus endosymbiosus TaxID=33865 RepID=A0A9E7PR00_9EURY|nr:hypothetical protein [Methanoplanus endosymbiosus]UUX93261.1 hypothetical protein L6E24_03810 [Methanoplanus endosymbiosus]